MDAEHQVTLILLSSDLIKQVVQCFLRGRVVKEEKLLRPLLFMVKHVTISSFYLYVLCRIVGIRSKHKNKMPKLIFKKENYCS